MSELCPRNPSHWREIAENSCFRPTSIPDETGVPYSTFRGWITQKARPRDAERAVKVMDFLCKKPAIKKHPSYGWATPEQIAKLQALRIGPERDALLKKIEKQNKAKGKI